MPLHTMSHVGLSYWSTENGSLVKMVNDKKGVKDMLKEIYPVAFMSLSFKGERLSANGSISLITVKAAGLIYLLDIQKLGSDAFFVKSAKKSLASILSSEYIKKAIYDCRNASNALYGIFGITMKGILDVQLFHLANLPHTERKVLPGLSDALGKYTILSNEWLPVFKEAKRIFSSTYVYAKGGDESLLRKRPIDDMVVAYASMDVFFLEQLYDSSRAYLSPDWLTCIAEETVKRLLNARSPHYQPWSKKRRYGPESWVALPCPSTIKNKILETGIFADATSRKNGQAT